LLIQTVGFTLLKHTALDLLVNVGYDIGYYELMFVVLDNLTNLVRKKVQGVLVLVAALHRRNVLETAAAAMYDMSAK
jgi:hypothetical protein